MQALLDVIIPVFLVIGAGYLATWKGYFTETNVDTLMKFAQGFAIPCLVFRAMANLDLGAEFDFPLLFSYYLGAVGCFGLGILGARLLFSRGWPDAIAIGFCCLFSNSILLGLPITERAYGVDALAGNYAIIAVHAPVCYFLGVTAMEIAKGTGNGLWLTSRNIARSMFHNALIVGIGLGLLVNIFSIPLPTALRDGIDLLASAALPAALFGLGGILVRYRPEGDLKTIAMVCVISLIIHPLITFSTATALELDRDALRSVALTATMGSGVNSYLFANMYGTARRVAASSVLISTALSVVTVWAWLLLIP